MSKYERPQEANTAINKLEFTPIVSDHKIEVAEIILDIKDCFLFSSKEPYILDSTILSPFYTDSRLILSSPHYRGKIVDFLAEEVKRIRIPDVIAGVATGGIPYATSIADKLNLPLTYIKPQPKEHGTGRQVEGRIEPGQEAIAIEDSISTAGSSVRAIEALRKKGAIVNDEIAIFTRGMKESEENLKKAGIRLHALTDLETVLGVALRKGYLKEDQVEIINEWSKDPRSWVNLKSL